MLGASSMALRTRALEVLHDTLAPFGEFLDLDMVDGTGPVTVFNVTCVPDVLDENASELVRLSTGQIIDVNRYAFREEALDGLVVFQVRQSRALLVTDVVVDVIRSAGLSGHSVKPLWTRA